MVRVDGDQITVTDDFESTFGTNVSRLGDLPTIDDNPDDAVPESGRQAGRAELLAKKGVHLGACAGSGGTGTDPY